MCKRLLLLGGSQQQIPAIEYAKKAGYYTVLCDYLPDNPGQYAADEFYLVSTTDKEAVFAVAKKECVDGVVAYASDPAAPTAAYVAERMKLPTNPEAAVNILSYKHLFRRFLRDNGFYTPQSQECEAIETAYRALKDFHLPVIVKPTDSSGSKGVSLIRHKTEAKQALQYAMEFSKEKRIIIEEFIVQDHAYMIAGDVFLLDGEVVFWGLINSHRDAAEHPFVPTGNSFPLCIDECRLQIVKKEINRLCKALKLERGAFNVEIMFDKDDRMYFIEFGPRNGGNMIPQFLFAMSGVDLVQATIECALGNHKILFQANTCSGFYASYNVHVNKNGVFQGINYAEEIKPYIIREYIYKEPGDEMEQFTGANKLIGTVFLKFSSENEMREKLKNLAEKIQVRC